MSTSKNISHLREHLFNQLDSLCDLDKKVDLDRARMVCETSKQIIDSAKVEIEFAAVMKGAITMPFIENQEDSGDRPYQKTIPAPVAPILHKRAAPVDDDDEDEDEPARLSAAERMQKALNSGPGPDHPFRRAVHSRGH